jgi:tricorn protease
MGNYDGGKDLYTVSVDGGIPFRVTHHPATETLCDWTGQDQLLFFSTMQAGLARQDQLFIVSPLGGLPQKLPVPYGADASISPCGEWLAYTPFTRNFRTWKRYRGGWASEIWLFNLKNYTSEKITTWEGTDTYPMWHGHKLYYLSDRGENHRLNLWAYDTQTKEHQPLTHFSAFDCKFPALGPGTDGEGEIVFQNGSDLYLANLASGATRTVQVMIPGARPKLRTQRIAVSDRITNWGLSSTAKRIVVEARGDLWTLPQKNGPVLNLTRTSGVAERSPAWSPDGRWIAYFSDQSGEYELYIRQSDGKSEPQALTSGGAVFRYDPTWSPDAKRIAFTDKTGALYVHTVESKDTKFVDQDPWAGRAAVNWSHDSTWLAYTKTGENRQSAIWLYDVEANKSHQVTSGFFNDTAPTFDRKGEFLFFASNRAFDTLIHSEVAWSYMHVDTGILMAAPLRAEVQNPFLAKSDEETWETGKEEKADVPKDATSTTDELSKDGEKEKDNAADQESKDKKEPIKIDLEGFEQRAFQLPVKKGEYSGGIAVNDSGKLLYVRGSRLPGVQSAVYILDLADEKKEEKTVLSDCGSFQITADGKKLGVRKGDRFYIVDAAADQKLEDAIGTGDMVAAIEPQAEWRQLFRDGWRVMRDFFYDPNMHGVDWQAMYDHYVQMLEDCQSREDVSFVIDEMIAELNVGHAYNRGNPDLEEEPRVSVGMLGVDFELHEGAYLIKKIYRGAEWDYDARNPLDPLKKGDLAEGDYLLAVNRVPLDTTKDPWAAFVGLAGMTATLTVSGKPVMDESARDVLLELRGDESGLRFRAWIEQNRQYVDKKTGGRVGYLFVTNTSADGNNDLFRQFYGQIHKEALIIDERWNGGGYIPNLMIQLLNRPVLNYWARRDGKDWIWPPDTHAGPKCMLINSLSASGGDAFPYYFRQAGIGKLIGTRTWGGLVGISGNPALIDGGMVIAPTFGFYETDGTWGIEGHGVDPDIEVVDDPSKMVNGGDPQLDAAIDLMMTAIKTEPHTHPKKPAYPDRRGMGLPPEDR